MTHVLGLQGEGEDAASRSEVGRKRFMDAVLALTKAFKLAAGTPEAEGVKVEVGFFVAVQTAINKLDGGTGDRRNGAGSDFGIQQLVNQAVASTEVIDILSACGLDRLDIGVLSDEILLHVRAMEHKNLAVEALRKLLNDEIAARTRTNVVKNEDFSERLRKAIARNHNSGIDALQVIQALIALAKLLRDQPDDGLTPEEAAFYDALAKNESAAEVMGNQTLLVIASELVKVIRENSTVDWWRLDNPRKNMRVAVKRLLRKYGYPPDLQADAVNVVLLRTLLDARVRAADYLAPEQQLTVSDVAKRYGADVSDVSRSLQLLFLAPDLVERILDGTQPLALTAERLKRVGELPLLCDDQRALLG